MDDANKYLSAPLVKWYAPEWYAPESIYGDSVHQKPPVVCDHDILSPHATVRILDGKRWCHACTQWLQPAYQAGPLVETHKDGSATLSYGAAACNVAHLH